MYTLTGQVVEFAFFLAKPIRFVPRSRSLMVRQGRLGKGRRVGTEEAGRADGGETGRGGCDE